MNELDILEAFINEHRYTLTIQMILDKIGKLKNSEDDNDDKT
jgi:hypothetical protein